MDRVAWSRRGSRIGCGFVMLLLAVPLSGCIESLPEAQVGRPDIRNAIAKGQLTSPRAATVALASLDGAPEGMDSLFTNYLSNNQ